MRVESANAGYFLSVEDYAIALGEEAGEASLEAGCGWTRSLMQCFLRCVVLEMFLRANRSPRRFAASLTFLTLGWRGVSRIPASVGRQCLGGRGLSWRTCADSENEKRHDEVHGGPPWASLRHG